jgi:G3E family GTPase
LLAGFLGSGKTTTLKHVLENTEGVRVGVIVNDVASVNIDAKLIAQRPNQENQQNNNNNDDIIVELQNGCACCSLADELLGSIETLLKSGSDNSNPFDAIIVELSGVADPVAVQNNWNEAVAKGLNLAVTEAAVLGNVVTVIDATTFGTDYMTFDILKDRKQWFENEAAMDSDCTASRQVVELLAEQVEAADLIIINKQDLAGSEQVDITSSMAKSLNDKASIVTTSNGKVSATRLLGLGLRSKSVVSDCSDPDCTDISHSHSHDQACEDADCTDTSHSHAHAHDHACEDADCTDTSHSHSHDQACEDADCTDASHSHAHNNACEDADCTDTSHSHTHSHQSSTSTDNLGISNFVYKATRPFDGNRLMRLLFEWPVPIKDELDLSLLKDAAKVGYNIQGNDEEASPFIGVLRSKGFCWLAPTAWDGLQADVWRHNKAMYWSHAGKHLGIQDGGRFWASLPESTMKEFFATKPQEYKRILQEDFVTTEFGDRRQELVFIGVELQQAAIETALGDCLLTDEEMELYRAQLEKIK